MTLPDMAEIPGMKTNWLHPGKIVIEISNKDHYRVYHYASPERFRNYKEANDIEGILSLLYTAFN